jgi:hypothetical protein
MNDWNQPQQYQKPILVPMVPAINQYPPMGHQEGNFIQRIVEYAMRRAKQGKMRPQPSPLSSPMDTQPMGPIETRGAVQAPNKSINDFTNY